MLFMGSSTGLSAADSVGIETRQIRYNWGLIGISLKSKSVKQFGSVDNSLATVLKYKSDLHP